METSTHNVRDLAASERSVMERLVGHNLNEDQRLVIQIVSDDSPKTSGDAARPLQSVADWTGVYEGLSDEQVEAIDKVVKTRCDLTRNLP